MASRVTANGRRRYAQNTLAARGFMGQKSVRHYGAKQTTYSGGEVKMTSRLDVRDITKVATREIDVLWIPQFCTPRARDQALGHLASRTIEDYQNAEGVGKYKGLGVAYFEATDEESKKQYYTQATSTLEKTREIFAPYQSPADNVRMTLDDQWTHGASLLRLDEKPMFFGLIRAISTEILPHEDKLDRDDPTITEKVHYCSQIAFNCYLQMPKEGGDLHLWDFDLSTESYDTLRGDSYGIARDKLPSPSVIIKPEAGDFVAFNGRRLHAVSPSVETNKVRVTQSGFVLYQGEDKPLHFWS